MDTTGSVVVTSGTMNHGQSHETTFAQIVADRLGLDVARVKLRQGDTERITYGWGTFASRSVTIGGSAVALASERLGELLCRIAAHLLETRPDNVALDGDGGVVQLDDPARRLPFEDIADVAYLRVAPAAQGRRARAHRDGELRRLRRRHLLQRHPRRRRRGSTRAPAEMRDPALRLRGGLRGRDQPAWSSTGSAAAGSRRASPAHCSRRSPTTTTASRRRPSFIDYMVPTATEIPDVSIQHLETPCAFTANGAKGAGEGGTIGAPAAVLNAVNDALRHTGVELDTTPIHPRTVLAALEGEL